MGAHRTRIAGVLLSGVVLTLAGALPARAAGDSEAGRKIAQTHCSRCHVIGSYNKMGGIMSTPSFQLLVNALKDYRERFETFYARRPHPVFIRVKGFKPLNDLPPNAAPVDIELDDVDNLLAFVETLKKKKP